MLHCFLILPILFGSACVHPTVGYGMDTIIRPGDSWVVHGIPSCSFLREIPLNASWTLLFAEDAEVAFECPADRLQTARYCPENCSLILSEGLPWQRSDPPYAARLHLVRQNPLTFRLSLEMVSSQLEQETATEHGVTLSFLNDLP